MLYKKFSEIKVEIENSNYQLAEKLLSQCKDQAVTDSDFSLFEALNARIPKNFRKNEVNYCYNTLSEFDNREIHPGISIVSCCMNRNENLKKALVSWIELPVDEIVIVDWSSSTPVEESIKGFKDKRIKTVRVQNENKWILTYGFNVGLRFASYSKIFKFDADIIVREDFLTQNSFSRGSFIRGNWKSALNKGLESQVYINGSFGAYKKDLEKIGYYNELIRTYGWDDSDLYERLSSEAALATKFLNIHSVIHLEQTEEERTENQSINTDSFLGKIPNTQFYNQRNKFIARTTDYWNLKRLQNYSMNRISENKWIAERVTEDIDIPSYKMENANIYAAIHFISIHYPKILASDVSQVDLAKIVLNEYNAKASFNKTLTLLGQNRTNHELIIYNDSFGSLDTFIRDCLYKAKSKSEIFYVLIVGNDYCHHTLRRYNAEVEIIIAPLKILDTLLAYRQCKGLKTIEIKSPKVMKQKHIEILLKKYSKKYIYIDAQHGLGNRLRAIASGAAIAKNTGRELIIIWQPDHHCECEFYDLFEYKGIVISKSFINEAKQSGMDTYNYMTAERGSEKDKPILLGDNNIYIRTSCVAVCESTNWNDENQFLKSLTPVKSIRDLVAPFKLDNHLAVHVRMEGAVGSDTHSYDLADNWTNKEHAVLNYWREKSNYKHFIKHIDKILKAEPDTNIFLAADLAETYEVFTRYYGDKVAFLKRDIYDRSKKQLEFALADAILLSKCKRLLGSNWSSFSEVAMRITKGYSSIEISGKDF